MQNVDLREDQCWFVVLNVSVLTKQYIREDLIPTLPFYKLPKSVPMCTRARSFPTQRAQVTSNSKF